MIMRRRCNFTLIEMLVVIAVIAILAALLSPALRKAQRSAQGTLCANNMRNMGMAGTMYATQSHNAWVPFDGMCGGENQYCNNARWGNNMLFLELLGKPNATDWPPNRIYWKNDALCPLATPVRNASYPGAGSVQDRCYALISNNTLTPIPNSKVSNSSLRYYVRLSLVRHPSQRFAFNEIAGNGGEFGIYGNTLEKYLGTDPDNTDVYGRIAYRHGNQDSTNCCFLDGHVVTKPHFEVNWEFGGALNKNNSIAMQYAPYDKIPYN